MADFLVYRILDGKLEFKDVPVKLKEEVKAVLVDMGHEELAK